MGIRYRAGFPDITELSNLPDSARSAILDCQNYQIGRDRGRTRERNDKTVDTRANHFAQWLSEHSLDNRNIYSVTQTAATALIAAYIHDCANNGYTIKPGDLLNDETLSRYTAAAVYWFQAHVPSLKDLNIGDPSRLTSLHPSIRDTITTCRRWQQPKPKRLPYTDDMYITLKTRVDDARADDKGVL